jgi:hypothetical protein
MVMNDVRVSLAIKSHLNDAMIEMNIPQLQEQAQERLDFVKYLVHVFPNTNVRVDIRKVYKEFKADNQ